MRTTGFLQIKVYFKHYQTTNSTQKLCFLENIYHLLVSGGTSNLQDFQSLDIGKDSSLNA